jgi:YbbR domain-containing protein
VAQYKLNEVATVKALVDINNIANPEEGIITLSDVPIIAYDENGNVVDVEIVPATITATITITSPSKIVPIKIVPTGTVAFGKAISEINSSVSSVTILW